MKVKDQKGNGVEKKTQLVLFKVKIVQYLVLQLEKEYFVMTLLQLSEIQLERARFNIFYVT